MQKHYVVDFFVKNNPAVDVAFIKNKYVAKYGPSTATSLVKYRGYDQGTDPDFFNQFPGAVATDVVRNFFFDTYIKDDFVSQAQLNLDVAAMVASVSNSVVFNITLL
jgi:hypothetical protein